MLKKYYWLEVLLVKPKILFYEDPTDTMDDQVANKLIDFLTARAQLDNHSVKKTIGRQNADIYKRTNYLRSKKITVC
jgi:predicted ABC-type transport system involved in lysophospholipase L1 biosynthesis ATPase subunit